MIEEYTMTRFICRPDQNDVREGRVCLPLQSTGSMFHGWGPKF